MQPQTTGYSFSLSKSTVETLTEIVDCCKDYCYNCNIGLRQVDTFWRKIHNKLERRTHMNKTPKNRETFHVWQEETAPEIKHSVSKGKSYSRCIYAAISFGLLLLGYLLLTVKTPDMSFHNESVYSLDGIWQVTHRNETNSFTLPLRLDTQKKDKVTYSIVLDGETENRNSIMLQSFQQYYKIYLDGELLFDYGYHNQTPFGNKPCNAWVIVRLPDNWHGKTLTIEQTAYYDTYAGKLDAVYMGTKNAMVSMVLYQSLPKLITNFSIALISFILFCSSFFFKRKNIMLQLRYLSLFAFFTSLWFLLESGGSQFYCSAPPITYFAVFNVFALLPILCVRFILTYESFANSRYMNGLFLLAVMNFFTVHLLQILGLMDYLQSITGSHILLFLTFAGIIVKFTSSQRSGQKLADIHLYISFLILGVFAFIDILRFYLGNPINSPITFSQIGMLLFVLSLSLFALKKIAVDNENSFKQEFLRHMAFTDILTGLPNRNAFEHELEYYRKTSKAVQPLLIMIADLNNLKYINDTMGHSQGDLAITETAHALQKHFAQTAHIFRIGGDEFCLIAQAMELPEFHSKINAFQKELDSLAQTRKLPLSVAHGICLDTSIHIDKALREADSAMYCQKAAMKKKSIL